MLSLTLDLLGLHVLAHLNKLRSMWAHFVNVWSLRNCGYKFWKVDVSKIRSSTYVVLLHVACEVK